MRAKMVSNHGDTDGPFSLSGFSLRIAPLILEYGTAANPAVRVNYGLDVYSVEVRC